MRQAFHEAISTGMLVRGASVEHDAPLAKQTDARRPHLKRASLKLTGRTSERRNERANRRLHRDPGSAAAVNRVECMATQNPDSDLAALDVELGLDLCALKLRPDALKPPGIGEGPRMLLPINAMADRLAPNRPA